jgi:beta-ureidopropionase
MVRIALIQFVADFDKNTNMEKIIRYTKESAENGAQIICHQELATTYYFGIDQELSHFKEAEVIPGKSTEIVGKIARELKVVIILPLFEKVVEGEYYNTAAVIGVEGEIMGRYRKTHIPEATSLDEETGIEKFYSEKFYFRPGNLGFPVFETPFGAKFGIIICYDRHFPEASRMVALGGADILFIPTATAGVTCKLWDVELRFLAMSNVFYVGGVNRVGRDTGILTPRKHLGSSIIVDPKGQIIAQAGNERDQIIYADVDLNAIRDLRNHCGYYRDRRPEIYSKICQ